MVTKGAYVVPAGLPLAIASGVETAIIWDTPIVDTGGFWSGGDPTRFTAPATGFYALSVRDQLPIASGTFFTYWRKNGTDLLFTQTSTVSGNNYHAPNGSVYLVNTDYVELILFQTSGSDATVDNNFFATFIQWP